MGIFAKLKSPSKNINNLKLTSKSTRDEQSEIIELDMSTKEASADEREEGEIIDEFEDIISSDEEFSMRKRIEELEAKNAELEKIANISASAIYASGGYNDYPKKDSHHLDRYPLVSIDISDDEDYPPAPKMPRISKRRKSMQHSSSRHSSKLLHTSSGSSNRRRKRSSSPPPAPSYRQSDKLLLSLFHERVASQNSHSSKRKRKSKKTHTKSSRRKSREYNFSDSNDDYFDSYNADDNSHERLNTSDCDKSYSLNRDELRVALARNTHRIEQHASLKDRLTRKKENTNTFNFVSSVEDLPPQKEVVVDLAVQEDEEEEQQQQIEKPSSPVEEEKPESEDNLEEQELRILALKSAVLKKHMVRKKRNENVAYSPSDFDEIYKCINESPTLNNIDEQETCNSMEISPVPSPKMILSDDGGGIDTKPVDMDIANSDSECELPSYDKWIPIEQIPLPNSIEVNEEIYNPTPMRYNNNQQNHLMPPDMRFESASVSPKNFDSDVDEEEFALRALLLAKMNSPKVNKSVKEPPPKIIQQVQSPDPDVSLEAEALRNFLIDNMKKKAKPQNSSASVLKEAVRRLTGRNASSSPTDNSNQIRCPVKTSDETEMELSQAITDMAKVKIGFEQKQDTRKNEVSSGLIRVRNFESLRAPQRDAEQSSNVIPKIVINQQNRNSKENPISTNNQKTSNEPEKFQSINFGANKILVKKETLLAKENNSNNVLKSVSNENNKSANVAIPGKTAKTISPSILEVVTQNIAVKANSDSKRMGQIESNKVECQPIPEISPSELSTSDIIESKQEKEVPNKEVHVKVEKEKSNENGSLTSKLEKQIPSKTVVIQETSDSNDVAVVESESLIQTSKIVKERVSTPKNYEDVDPKETEDKISKVSIIQNKDQEDLPENEALTEKDDSAEKEAFTEKEGTKNVVVKNVDEITSKTNLENIASALIEKEQKVTILLEHKISDVALETKDITKVQSVNASIVLKQIGPTRIVDHKDMEKDLTNKALEESPNKEIVSEATKSVLEVDTTEPSEAGVNQSLLIQKVNSEDVVSDTKISKTNVIQEITSEFSTIEDSSSTSYSNLEETMIDVNSNTTSKSDVKTIQHKEKICNELNEKQIVLESISKPVESSNTFAVSPPTTSQVQLSTKSIEVKLQPKKIVGTGNKAVQTKTQNVSKSQSIQKATEKVQKSDKPLIKSTMSTPTKILPSTTVVVAQKPITKLPTQQPITIRTKIVKPNKVINQQQPMELKRKTVDTNLPQTSVPPKKPKTDDTNRLITTAEIPKVPDLIIQLRASESESEYSELGAEDMEEDEDEQVHNFFNRSITIGNEYYDIASPISLPMESPCNTPTNSGSPMVSRTQTPQPPVEKSIVNDYFEAKLEQFLKTVRSKVSVSDNNTTIKSTLFEGQEITSTNSTPVAVRHLPESSQQEYRRLINRMKMLERQKQAKNLQVQVKASDAGAGSESRSGLTDGDSKFLVRKVLVKNATAKPSPIVIQKSSSPGKTEQQNIQKPSTSPKSVKSPQKSNTSPVSQDTAKSKENLLVLYENSYRKTGASIIASLDKSIQMVQVAKIAKMGKLKCEQRLKELRKEMEEVQKNLKTQQEKITKIYPEICNSHRAIESLKTRRTKINKAVTALGKSVIGPNYSMKNDQKSIISERSKKLAAEIKFVNTMKISDIEAALATPKRTNLPENAKTIVAPAQQNINKTIDEKHPAKSLQTQDPPQKDKESIEIQMPANSLQEQIPAHTSNMAPSSTLSPSSPTIENEVPACDSESSPESLNKTVPEDIEEDHMNITIVPEILSNKDDDDKASSTTTNGHEEALELEQSVVVVGGDNDNKNNIEQAPDQTNMDENIEEENGDLQVGSAKLHDYVSPLSHLRDERHINPNGVVCPYQLMGQCDDKDCKYMHLED
ncbi:uncharacterized protein LOC129918320 isoform X2 [Episyrphus balteatus]|uniref:uncharacterized protein LOC129918320 isoform X2 n=1 Tax=Episyrphus balteatus TaxID=286459 RepID=UPI0024868C63|nr:uncharacterized protein LOC129918320 isoform X2 [Episyrphus balteatus]